MNTLIKKLVLSFLAPILISINNSAMYRTDQGSILPVSTLLNPKDPDPKNVPAYTNKCDPTFHLWIGKMALGANIKRKTKEAPLDQADNQACQILLNLSKQK